MSTSTSTSIVNSPVMPILSSFALSDVDMMSIAASQGYVFPNGAKTNDLSFIISDFITGELEKVGGKAVVEVDNDICTLCWNPPVSSSLSGNSLLLSVLNGGDSDLELVRLAYVCHLLQAGLMRDPSKMIANTAYAGNGLALAQTLLMINAQKFNTYIAERDMMLLAMSVPMMSSVWLTLGMMLLANHKCKRAEEIFLHLLSYEPENLMGLRYMVVAQTGCEDGMAVTFAERLFNVLAKFGIAPDSHARAAYGFALLKVGLEREAGVQFQLACGVSDIKMTMEQWVMWGFSLPHELLVKALKDPVALTDEFWSGKGGTGDGTGDGNGTGSGVHPLF